MKRTSLFLSLVFFAICTNAQTINIPDPVFKALLVAANEQYNFARDVNGFPVTIDSNTDGEIQASELLPVHYLYLNGNFLPEGLDHHITSLEGISSFVNLEILNCPFLFLTSLDIQNLPYLKGIDASYNLLTSMALANLPALQSIYCTDNDLQTMTLTNLPQLSILYCNSNQFTALDLTSVPSLGVLNCVNNQLASLQLSGLTDLTVLECGANQLESLNLDGLVSLYDLKCNENLLTSLDLNDQPLLQFLKCNHNALVSINCSGSLSLMEIDCSENQLTSLDLQNLSVLQSVRCSHNLLSALIFGGNTALNLLDCDANQLEVLDISGLLLQNLICDNNQLTTLDLSNASVFRVLSCAFNQLQNLDLSNFGTANEFLGSFDCSDNQLQTLYMKNGRNDIASFSNNPNLTYVCADPHEILTIHNLILQYGYTNCTLNSDCNLANEDFETSDGIVLYPNPAMDTLKFETNSAIQITAVTVYNMMGQTVLSKRESTSNLDVSSLASGTYFIRIDSDKGILNKKFAKE